MGLGFLNPTSQHIMHKNIISTDTQVKCIERGDRDDTFWLCSFDQGICTYVWVTLCTLEKNQLFPLPLPLFTPRYHPHSHLFHYPSSL